MQNDQTEPFEPLLDSPTAAKLLGGIHVKTLQRYARTKQIPGYHIGKLWFFRASELDSWLESRQDSPCQPVDAWISHKEHRK